jgi:AcrR family transcriptional regulator
MTSIPRKTAAERRAAVVRAARSQFAEHGYHGASTETIARRAGISQPYLFRLFGTKKDLFIAAARSCMEETLAAFKDAADGLTGPDALAAIGSRYAELLGDRQMLTMQLQTYAAACNDREIQQAAREGYGALFEYVERVSGAGSDVVTEFFSHGMLINVIVALELQHSGAPWAARLTDSCFAHRQT